MTNQDRPVTAADLRRRAEDRLKSQPTTSRESLSEVETQRLLHELQVRQIELEIQNEELGASLARYIEFHDFAPVGYLTLANDGAIGQANWAAASLLNVERAELPGQQLKTFVAEADRYSFIAFLVQVFATDANQTCELMLTATRIVQVNAMRNSDRRECRAILLDITERKRAEAVLHKSEAQLRQLFEKIPAGIYFCDAEGLITSFNQRAVESWGREPRTNDPAYRFCGSFRLFATDGSPIAVDECWMARALRENKEYLEQEIIVGREDGSRRVLLAHASPLHDESGKITGGLNVVVDITERKRIEAALRESKNRLNLAVDAAHLGIFEHDHGADTAYWSPTFRQIFGWKDDEPASLSAYLELIHPEDRAEVTAAVQNAHDPSGTGQYRIEHRILLRDDSVRWINVLSCTTFAGIATERHAVVTTGTIADITDLKQAEESLRENQSRTQLLVQAAHIGMWDWNLLTNEVYLSPVWKSQLGYTDEEVPNRYEEWESRLHPDDRDRMLTAIKARQENNNRYDEVEFRMRHKDGSWRWILNRDEFERAADGRGMRMMGSHIDITSRKQNESELQASRDRLASLSHQLIAVQETERRQLARELHDEIGQALGAISVNLKTIHRKVDAAFQSRLEESIGIVDRAIQQVRDLALDLRPAMLDDFGLETALRWYATRFAERAGLTAHVTTCLSQQALPETVRNTCFRLTQESLTNVLRHGKARQVWIDVHQQEDWLTLTIRDDGDGFDVPLAFERASRGGSLGLISMQERVQLLGGRLDIESQLGVGTVVRARLPVPLLEDSTEEEDDHP